MIDVIFTRGHLFTKNWPYQINKVALYIKVTCNITGFRYDLATKFFFTTKTTISYFQYVSKIQMMITQNSSCKV